ncbi:MAG TPA: potassium transporter [Anaeromyxobacteraceae bacterium]|nr:potassium transporter [Anaeromyxobacteraceae bacterium]
MSNLGSTRVFGHSHGGVVEVGLRRRPLKDLYHWLVTGSWGRLLAVYGLVYFATEGIFAALDLAAGDAPSSRGAFASAVVEAIRAPVDGRDPTLALRTMLAGVVSSVEGFIRWLEVAIGAGIILNKFSLLRARIIFSRVAVIAPGDDGPALMFRMANERVSNIIDAKVNALLVWNEADEKGELVRRAHDLPLARGGSALFTHAWTASHPIDRESPLYRCDETALQLAEAELIVSLSGYDEALTRVMYARHVYPAEQVLWNFRFREIVKALPDGRRRIDYRRFHEAEPVAKEERSAKGRKR